MDPRDGLTKSEMESADDSMSWELPKAQGLYDPQNEHEACGVGFIVAIDGRRSHKVLIFPFLFDLSLIISFFTDIA